MSVLPNAGSGSVSRFGTSLRLGILKSPKAFLALLDIRGEDGHRERIFSASGKRRIKNSAGANRSPINNVIKEVY